MADKHDIAETAMQRMRDYQALYDNNDARTKMNEVLKNIGRRLNAQYDVLYPIEVLGAYYAVHKGTWYSHGKGNPEKWIDDKLSEFVATTNKEEFRNNLKMALENEEVKYAFKLRLNYAVLLKETIDTIEIRHSARHGLPFNDELNDVNEYIGNLRSSSDLTNEEIEKRSEEFYAIRKIAKTIKNGTPEPLRIKINNFMNQSDMEINDNLNEVYMELKKFNRDNLELGLVARLAYIAFASMMQNNETFSIEHKQ